MMEFGTISNEFLYNKTSTAVSVATVSFSANNSSNDNAREESIRIIQSSVASVGIIANLTVIVVFLNDKKLRRKIPNIFIISQVLKYSTTVFFKSSDFPVYLRIALIFTDFPTPMCPAGIIEYQSHP